MTMRSNARKRPVPPGAVYIDAPQVCVRYGGRSGMWLERKLQHDPKFPRPKYFGRLRFFTLAELEQYERASVAAPTTDPETTKSRRGSKQSSNGDDGEDEPA